ncbi:MULTISPECIES: hypothetical protein [Bacillota]|uniref:Uncharacterized protein n=1 Tax=Blautia pseudococcoides TaxID=1796616 RepID=A0A1C7IH90_9FIRM|nr:MULTISPECIES: hypothetical protein [Bacillota]ANU77522.1 hypothetical protein A4V09_18280 [Blautia pseudococcoides]ASU30323.1 hypothetical protein ADH70_016830 [Blautia pseudococcoides]MDL4907177.1 hypothetical protein [Enterococcus gallinarum]QQQ95110.1 hypothetical protein I5Q86_10575 [Blautia pseudococcoides]
MHFLTLAILEIPEVREDKELDKQIVEALKELELQKQIETKNFMLDFTIGRFQNLQSSFSRAVNDGVSELMYPYCESLEDPEYLEFEDRTEKLREEYESVVDCIKLPQGTIVEQYGDPLWGRFVVRDGKVFQRDAGSLHHEKRTKKAKRMVALPNYPRKKLYKSFEKYAEERCGFSFDEKHQGYGYYYNPNAIWDWYSIGGRWPEMFLVKDACTEYSIGERSWCNSDRKSEAPEGYRWVCAARKKDIAWDAMRDWRNQKAAERFHKLEQMFLAGKTDPDFHGEIVPDGVMHWGELVYRKDSTLEEYLEEYGIPGCWKYPVGSHDIVDEGQWLSVEDSVQDPGTGSYAPVDWRSCIDGYIDDMDEDMVLVSVDYHI